MPVVPLVRPVRLAGYQGPSSILSHGLARLTNTLSQRQPQWQLHCEGNVTSQGESARALFDSIESGARQIGYMASGYLVQKVPELALLDTPFAVQDRAQALAALDGSVGQWLSQCITQRTGYKLLGFWDNGFRHLSNRVHAITRPTDAQGLTIRTLDSDVYRRALASMGFAPVSIDVKDLVPALASGTVDAQENPLANFRLFSMEKYHAHLSLSSHFFGVLLLLCHRAWFESLSDVEAAQVQEAAVVATQYQRDLAVREDETGLTAIRAQPVQIVMPSELDLPSFHRATRAVRDDVLRALPSRYVQDYVQ